MDTGLEQDTARAREVGGWWLQTPSFVTSRTFVTGGTITRTYSLVGAPRPFYVENIYPVWVPTPQAATDTSDWSSHWGDDKTQTQTTAKWIASIVGVALAATVGTAPLTGLKDDTLSWPFYVLALSGLLGIGVMLWFVLRVLSPDITTIDDLLHARRTGHLHSAERALANLREKIEKDHGLQLPNGIRTLGELAGRSRLEEVTLGELSQDVAGATTAEAKTMLTAALAARGQWYAYLQQTLEQLVVLASFQRVRSYATQARWIGLPAGLAGLALLTAAFLVPAAPAPAPTLTAFQLSDLDRDGHTTAAQRTLGSGCRTFDGLIVGHSAPADSTASTATVWDVVDVQAGDGCAAAEITVPDAALLREPTS